MRLLDEFIEEIKKFGTRRASVLSGVTHSAIKKWCSKEAIPTLINAQKVADVMGLEFLLFEKE